MKRSIFAALLMLFFTQPAYSLERTPLDDYLTVQGVLKTWKITDGSPPLTSIGVEATLNGKVLFTEHNPESADSFTFTTIDSAWTYPKEASYKILLFDLSCEEYRFCGNKLRLVDLSVKGKIVVTPELGNGFGKLKVTKKEGKLLMEFKPFFRHPGVSYEYSSQEGLKEIKPSTTGE